MATKRITVLQQLQASLNQSVNLLFLTEDLGNERALIGAVGILPYILQDLARNIGNRVTSEEYRTFEDAIWNCQMAVKKLNPLYPQAMIAWKTEYCDQI